MYFQVKKVIPNIFVLLVYFSKWNYCMCFKVSFCCRTYNFFNVWIRIRLPSRLFFCFSQKRSFNPKNTFSVL